MSETRVRAGDVSICVRDHGGDGTPVVLVHGAGGNLLTWEQFAPLLTDSHRVLAMDLRGHGRSDDGAWQWEAVLDDIESVVEHFRLDNPALVGHSLGGMVAGMWGARHGNCPAAISLDGHRPATTWPTNYVGAADDIRRDLAKLTEVFDQQAEALAQPLAPEEVEAMLEQQRAVAATHGLDEGFWLAATRRGLITRNEQTYVRPDETLTSALRRSPEFIDAVPRFHQVACPFLIVMATKNLPEVPEEFAALMDAFRAGLRRDLGTLADARPNVWVTEIDASHGMVFERPTHVAELVLDFLQ